jgi:hypothetical protein
MIARLFLVALVTAPFAASARADDPTPEERIQMARDRAKSQNNLKQIGLAFHNYADANNKFPANVADEKGKLLLSWRVILLSYLDHEALFKEFKLDEPWDSTHNKKLIEKMPKVYTPVRGKAGKGETFYRGLTGPSTIFEAGKELRFQNVTDGTSNTILCVEAEKSVPWTKPDDLPFDPKKDELPKVGGAMFEAGFNCLICDGSVRFIKKDVAKETLKALITRDGGEVINLP